MMYVCLNDAVANKVTGLCSWAPPPGKAGNATNASVGVEDAEERRRRLAVPPHDGTSHCSAGSDINTCHGPTELSMKHRNKLGSLVAALGIEPALEDEIGSMDAAAAEALIASHWDTFMARP